MSYQSIEDLPATIRDVLPKDAQEMYLEVYNRAWEQYDPDAGMGLSRDGMAHQQGWRAVEQDFARDVNTGEWRRKGEEQAEDEEKPPQGLFAKIKSLF